jgi:DNA-binding LacI/PurR family transcriptional regulator
MLGINAGLAERDRRFVLMLAPTREEEARIERHLVSAQIDGIVLVGPHGADPLVKRLVRSGLPMVVSGRPVGSPSVSYVDTQNREGAAAAVQHFIESGRQVIATIHGTLDLPSAADRLEGYRDALRAAGRSLDPALEMPGEYQAKTAADAMTTLLARRPDLDALFAASDSMAIAALQAIKDTGRRVPDDVAVIGFDDLPTAHALDRAPAHRGHGAGDGAARAPADQRARQCRQPGRLRDRARPARLDRPRFRRGHRFLRGLLAGGCLRSCRTADDRPSLSALRPFSRPP